MLFFSSKIVVILRPPTATPALPSMFYEGGPSKDRITLVCPQIYFFLSNAFASTLHVPRSTIYLLSPRRKHPVFQQQIQGASIDWCARTPRAAITRTFSPGPASPKSATESFFSFTVENKALDLGHGPQVDMSPAPLLQIILMVWFVLVIPVSCS